MNVLTKKENSGLRVIHGRVKNFIFPVREFFKRKLNQTLPNERNLIKM